MGPSATGRSLRIDLSKFEDPNGRAYARKQGGTKRVSMGKFCDMVTRCIVRLLVISSNKKGKDKNYPHRCVKKGSKRLEGKTQDL